MRKDYPQQILWHLYILKWLDTYNISILFAKVQLFFFIGSFSRSTSLVEYDKLRFKPSFIMFYYVQNGASFSSWMLNCLMRSSPKMLNMKVRCLAANSLSFLASVHYRLLRARVSGSVPIADLERMRSKSHAKKLGGYFYAVLFHNLFLVLSLLPKPVVTIQQLYLFYAAFF